MDDTKRGLYRKYSKIERDDGSTGPGEKHEKCEFFVLDLEHDKHAKAAIRAYAESCAKEFPGVGKGSSRDAEADAGLRLSLCFSRWMRTVLLDASKTIIR